VKAPVTILQGAAPGDAMTLKLLRSIFMKELEALTVETFVLAHRLNLVNALHDNLKDFDDAPLRGFLEMLLRTHVLHAERRLQEVEEAEM
jgi:3-hydroxyisobutyrate dehydrogenase